MKLLEKIFSYAPAFIYKKSGKYPGIDFAYDDILQLVSGLCASAGTVILTQNKSALFVDGRYMHAAKKVVDQNKFEILDLKQGEIIRWIKENISQNIEIAFDPRCHTHDEIKFFNDKLRSHKLIPADLMGITNSTISRRNLDIHYIKDKKTTDEKKLSLLYELISKNELDAYLICDPCTVAWLLDIRDFNTKYTPVVLCYMLITKDRKIVLYMDNIYDLEYSNNVKSEQDLLEDINKFNRVGIDKKETPFYITHNNFVHIKNPCLIIKAVKTEEEINNIKNAAIKDSIAIINFLHWFHSNSNQNSITELDVVEKILYFKKLQQDFIGESFKTIAAADEHAAIVHYCPSIKSNKTIENILLLDCGGQYKYGTTDITRTISLKNPTSDQIFFYTMVLKGHIALADVKFPVGTTGAQLDSLARKFLWQYSQDYSHSTGHGIGYMLCVHEGPSAISKINNIALNSGMLFSNEPGYYKDSEFGIRLENMMLTKKEPNDFLSFETISLVPFDSKFINKNLLTTTEISWLKTYNQKIIEALKMQNAVTDWLLNYMKL